MNKLLSSFTAIAVYMRITEMDHAMPFAVICGAAIGALANYVLHKKRPQSCNSYGQR